LTIKFTHEQQTRSEISNFRSQIKTLSNFTDACTVKLALCVFYLTSTPLISNLKVQI
jgi:hypothetical protein